MFETEFVCDLEFEICLVFGICDLGFLKGKGIRPPGLSLISLPFELEI